MILLVLKIEQNENNDSHTQILKTIYLNAKIICSCNVYLDTRMVLLSWYSPCSCIVNFDLRWFIYPGTVPATVLLLLLKNTSGDVLIPKEVTPICTSPHETCTTTPGVD